MLRNIGSSIYISLTITIVIRSTSINYSDLANFINPFNEILLFGREMGSPNSNMFFDLSNLSGEIERQSAMIGYINAFYFLAITGFLALPLIFFVKSFASGKES